MNTVTIDTSTLKRIIEALAESRPHEEDFDFGPAYEAAKQRHRDALRQANAALRRAS